MSILRVIFLLFVLVLAVNTISVASQIEGKVRDRQTGEPIKGANVIVSGTSFGSTTGPDGYYGIQNLPAGMYTVIVSFIGFRSDSTSVDVIAGQLVEVNFSIERIFVPMGDVIVYGASRHPERITKAPVSISTIDAKNIARNMSTAQVPRLFDALPGIDIVQNGMNDYNFNARGFNTVINRRMLVLLDNRDISSPLASYIEWNTFNHLSGDLSRVEVIRGPGSALYGANAFSGVVNIVTPAPKDIVGTKLSFSGGEMGSFNSDIRHAGAKGHWSYKLNAGRTRSKTWDKSRNLTPEQIADQEYEGLPTEVAPLSDDVVVSTYGSGRIDFTLDSGF